METLLASKTKEMRKERAELEKRLNVTITLNGNKVTIEGTPVDEYEALLVLDAMGFGFSAKKALLLLEQDMLFRKLHMKDFTRRKDMEEVRGRTIGREGKTKRTLESVSGCSIVISGNEVGVIGPAEAIDATTTALKKIIKGSKQANVYNYLERMNVERRKHQTDLGLKEPKKEE